MSNRDLSMYRRVIERHHLFPFQRLVHGLVPNLIETTIIQSEKDAVYTSSKR